MIVIADLGATNARFCVTEDGLTYSAVCTYPIDQYSSVEELCINYINKNNLETQKGVIGVAAPILNDKVTFVNVDLEFSIRSLEKKVFSNGLIVLNDLALQANALYNLDPKALTYIGENSLDKNKPIILVSPGTGLGLAGVLGKSVVSTEAGHINISDKVLKPDLKEIVESFVQKNSRMPTYEDFLSGKGIKYFYKFLSGDTATNLSNEDILQRRNDENCLKTIKLLNYLLSSYLRYVALIWGANGGVLLSGSIINSLITEEDHAVFRQTFEDSDTMHKFMKTVPLATLSIKDIGFVGGLEIAKKLL